MLPDRKLRIGILFIILALLVLYLMPDKTLNYWLGILFGGIVGGVTILYMIMNNVVDPERAKATYGERVRSPWIIIAVVGGALLGRLLIQKLSSTNLEVLFLSFMLTGIFLVFSYMTLRIWQADEPEWAGLPTDLAEELRQLKLLDDDHLWRVARMTVPVEELERMQTLTWKRQKEGLTSAEEQEARRLQKKADRVMFLQVQAAILLNKRGFDISELRPQSRLDTS